MKNKIKIDAQDVAYNEAIDEFEQNILKELEEVK